MTDAERGSLRVMAVSFLNALPLIHRLPAVAGARVELACDLPSRLAGRLAGGEADLALLPVVESFRGPRGAVMFGFGIACNGPVASVKLFCRGRVEDMTIVLADRGSRTSVALLRVLLAERYGLRPRFRDHEPRPRSLPEAGQGMLVIGDRCFAFDRRLREAGETDVTVLDLGEAWFEATGLPFVFATWAAAPALVRRCGREGLQDLSGLLGTALDQGLERLDEICRQQATAGMLGHGGEASVRAIDYYLRRCLHFRLAESDLDGMRLFQRKCIEHGLVPDAPFPDVV